MIKKLIKLIKLIFIFYLISFNQSIAIENKILFKVNNEIITSIDVLNEINYLTLINSDLLKMEKQKIYEISKNSLIREKIKEIDLIDKFQELSVDDDYLNKLIKNYSIRIGFKNTEELNFALKKKNIELDTVKKKITIELLWNQLIVDKFLKNVRIDEEIIKQNLKKQKTKNIYFQK